MRNKTSILVLTVVITAICLFYLSFSFVARGVNKDMLAYAEEQAEIATSENSSTDYNTAYKSAIKQYKDSIWNEEVYLGYTYEEVKKFELNLGLDLQGGIHITLIVSPEEIIKAMSGNNQDPDFLASIKEAKKLQQTQQEKFTTLFYDSWVERKGEGKLWEAFLTSDNQSKISSKSTDREIMEILNNELNDAIDRTMIVLRSRIDRFGATQPIIQSVESTGRIEIQLPGVDDEERIVNQVKAVAKLEFLEVWTPTEIAPYYQAINDYLVSIKDIEEAESEEEIESSEQVVPSAASSGLFADDTTEEAEETVADSLQEEEGLFAQTDDSATQAQDTIVQNSEFPIQDYFTLSQYGLYAKANDYDEVQALINNPDVQDILPSNMKLLWGVESKGEDAEGIVPVYFVKKEANIEAPLTGEVIVDARQDYDARGQVAVSMQMNVQGAKQWEKLTEANQNRQIAVVLDNVVYSAPVVNEPIPNGNSSISGNFSVQEAVDLASILKAGKLPAPTEIERMVVVGPSLGQESIDRGLMSLAFGLALVIVFMVAYYHKGGAVADLALLFNIFFILGVLSTPSFGTTLTLPGIAGIVLTIGMSIDANVLIFERIREELALGKPIQAAINNGYSKAFLTIIDSNVTTFITALILSVFGTGLVKGFAITLMIGIVCSFFTAVFVTRLFIEFMLGKKQDKSISFTTGLSKGLFNNLSFDFIGKRKVAYIVSSLLITVGIITIVIQGGLNLGVAFKGGHQYIVEFDKEVKASDAETALRNGFGEAGIQVKTFDGPEQLQITTNYREFVDENVEDVDEAVKAALMEGLSSYNDLNPHVVQTIVVGPTIADDIKTTSINSVIIALLAIFIYIFARFRRFQFGLGALVALFHDVLIVISVFSILRLIGISFEIDEVFIAAVLTIVGYSINDTVVVFDRVREGIQDRKLDSGLGLILNEALNNTLSRTLMTSVTTLIVILVLLIFGGEALRGFSFALFIGVLVGTYSSVFIATPVVLDTINKKKL